MQRRNAFADRTAQDSRKSDAASAHPPVRQTAIACRSPSVTERPSRAVRDARLMPRMATRSRCHRLFTPNPPPEPIDDTATDILSVERTAPPYRLHDASANAGGLSGSTSDAIAGVTNSSGPPHRVRMSGVPQASASAATEQNAPPRGRYDNEGTTAHRLGHSRRMGSVLSANRRLSPSEEISSWISRRSLAYARKHPRQDPQAQAGCGGLPPGRAAARRLV